MSVYVSHYTPTDPRLGRHIEHDDRSRDFAVLAREVGSLTSVRWDRWAPIFDQGQVGSCTAEAGYGCLGTTNLWPKVNHRKRPYLTGDVAKDQKACYRLYSAEQRLLFGKPYPPSDQGGSGLAIAKILKRRHLIPSYRHAFSFEAALTALAEQPVIVGLPWYEGMFHPDGDGLVRPTGVVAGGHEIVWDQLDVEHRLIGFPNSWGTGWGVQGRGFMTWNDAELLLAEGGDCTVFDH